MNELKYIKLENPDGTYSESIPLAVDSDYVNVNGETLTNELNKKPYYFNNVADMKADIKLKPGDMAITLGYYNINDGGAGEYHIISGDYTDDGGSYHELNNGLFAQLIIHNEINVKQFGAYGDGIHDDINAIKKILSLNIKNILFPYGTYNITNNIDINNKIIKGENSIIKTISQTVIREHQIIINGSCNISNITFFQANNSVALCGLFSNNMTIFENCKFIVDHVATNGYVDLYTNNKNVLFNNCYFEVDSYNNETLTVGGIWVREVNNNYITENIKFNSCIFNHNTIDECIAIWDWFGEVRNIYIDNCTFVAKSTCTSPHFINLDAKNCIFSNSIVYAPSTNSSSIFKGGNFNNKIINCNIFSYTIEINGISSGQLIFENCKINCNSSSVYLNTDTKNIYKNCIINCKNVIDSRKVELYNCTINMNGTSTNDRIFVGDFLAKNTVFNINKCKSLFESYWDGTLNINVENCEFNISSGQFLSLTNNPNITHTIKIKDCIINNGNIEGYSGYVATGYIINNISKNILNTITGVTMSNNTKIS